MTKTVILTKGGSEITVDLSKGHFKKVSNDVEIVVDGEWGRSGERCFNHWHGDYLDCKQAFLAYIGEKMLDGYILKSKTVKS